MEAAVVQSADMLKQTLLVLSVAVLAGIVIWVVPGGKAAEAPSSGGKPGVESRALKELSPGIAEPGDKVPRSKRHEDGEIEKHRAMAQSPEELDKAVKKQERMLEEKRRVLAHVIRESGMKFLRSHPGYVPPRETPEPTPAALEDTAHQAEMDRKDAEEGGRDGVGYLDAKRDFETYQQLLQKAQSMREEARKRLQGEGP